MSGVSPITATAMSPTRLGYFAKSDDNMLSLFRRETQLIRRRSHSDRNAKRANKKRAVLWLEANQEPEQRKQRPGRADSRDIIHTGREHQG